MALKMLPRIMNAKGFILSKLRKHKEAISTHKGVLRYTKRFSDLEVGDEIATAKNSIGFQLICLAKQLLQNGLRVDANRKLLEGRDELDSALDISEACANKSSLKSAILPKPADGCRGRSRLSAVAQSEVCTKKNLPLTPTLC